MPPPARRGLDRIRWPPPGHTFDPGPLVDADGVQLGHLLPDASLNPLLLGGAADRNRVWATWEKALRCASSKATIEILRRLLAEDWKHASRATWETRKSRYLHRKLNAEEAKQQGQY